MFCPEHHKVVSGLAELKAMTRITQQQISQMHADFRSDMLELRKELGAFKLAVAEDDKEALQINGQRREQIGELRGRMLAKLAGVSAGAGIGAVGLLEMLLYLVRVVRK